jgi:hypothetical protein
LQGDYDHDAGNASGRPRSHTLIRRYVQMRWQEFRAAPRLCLVRRSVLC